MSDSDLRRVAFVDTNWLRFPVVESVELRDESFQSLVDAARRLAAVSRSFLPGNLVPDPRLSDDEQAGEFQLRRDSIIASAHAVCLALNSIIKPLRVAPTGVYVSDWPWPCGTSRTLRTLDEMFRVLLIRWGWLAMMQSPETDYDPGLHYVTPEEMGEFEGLLASLEESLRAGRLRLQPDSVVVEVVERQAVEAKPTASLTPGKVEILHVLAAADRRLTKRMILERLRESGIPSESTTRIYLPGLRKAGLIDNVSRGPNTNHGYAITDAGREALRDL